MHLAPTRLLLVLSPLLGPVTAAVLQDPAQDPAQGLRDQDRDPGSPRSPLPPLPPSGAQTPLLASDGKPVAPGRIPDGTSPEALGLWRSLLAATGSAGLEPVRAFDLTFEVVHRRPGGINQFDAAFRYLDCEGGPYLGANLSSKDRLTLRGPRGDFFIEKDRVTRLEGRDYVEDRRQLEEWIAIARNFLALTQPDAVRLVSLDARRALAAEPGERPLAASRVVFDHGDPLQLPDPTLAQLARGLNWLEVRSPDFRLYQTKRSRAAEPVFRALLGLDPGSGEVKLAVLNEDRAGTIVIESTLLVIVQRYQSLDPGYHVPVGLELRRVDLNTSPWTFEQRDGTTLWLKRGGRLNPDLAPKDFVPR